MTYLIWYERPPLLPWVIYCFETLEIFRVRQIRINVSAESATDVKIESFPPKSGIKAVGIFKKVCKEYSEINHD